MLLMVLIIIMLKRDCICFSSRATLYEKAFLVAANDATAPFISFPTPLQAPALLVAVYPALSAALLCR